MIMNRKMTLCAVLAAISSVVLADESFYKNPPLFSTAPGTEKSQQSIDRFGPVGISIELTPPAFVMKVGGVEEGSPAAATGKLKPGQIIETLNGQKLKDIDPRIQLGDIVTAAEATDGLVKFMVKDSPSAPAQEVVVKIPVLGAYSRTWPLNCPKSDKIVRDFAEYLKKPGSSKGFSGLGMLFLLGTGDDKDLETVRQWVHGMVGKPAATYAWHLGYSGIPLCEYYLRTGDPEALPVIQKWVDSAVQREFLGGWSQKGGAAAVTYGGGGGLHNAAGTHVVTFLMLAKECGATIPDHTFNDVLTHFFRWAGRGNNSYGDNLPEQGLVDNGKNGKLAFAMAAAAALTPDGETSIYAGARDVAALTSFYTATFMLHGHTGGGIGEIWRSAAMCLLAGKRPEMVRDFLDARRWHYELSRRFDGSFGIVGGARYDDQEWGAGYALTYIVPRKTLRITGAPPTKFSKPFQLPARPWGTKADDAFDSIEPATMPDGTKPDFSRETLARDSGKPLLVTFLRPDLDDATIRRYAHHPDQFVRTVAANKAMGMNSAYLSKPVAAGDVRTKLAMELFHSADARVRRAILTAIRARFEGEELMTFLGQKGFDEVIGMVRDPAGSWWVKEAALGVVSRAPADAVAPHVDLITGFLKHEEWWLQSAALNALAPVATDERCYRKVIPAMAEMVRTCQRWNATGPLRYGPLAEALKLAGPKVQQLVAEEFQKTLAGYAGVRTGPGGLDISGVYNSHKEFIAETLAGVEGGYDLLYKIGKQQSPHDPLPFDTILLSADFDKFGPELREAIAPVIRDHLIYEYMVKNRGKLLAVAAGTEQNQFIEKASAMDDLVGLYQKINVTDYNWHEFGPDLKKHKWDYLMFDPPEKQAYDISPWRYRKVTLPAGMETWFKPDFDPVKAGWKQGLAPFGQYNGKLVTDLKELAGVKFKCQYPMRTLWDKEVLLMRGTLEFPALKPGHLYRLQIDNGNNVGLGDGYRIYINGKLLIEVKDGIGRRAGGRQRGAFITREFLDQFGKGPVTLAAIGFLRYCDKAVEVATPPVPQGAFSLWMEEMKLPPLDSATYQKAATAVGLRSAEWQTKQDPDDTDRSLDVGLFKYDGKFVANAHVLGDWTAVTLLPAGEEFNPAKRADLKGIPYKQITFKAGGTTDSTGMFWSGDLLMDLGKLQALKITPRTVGGTDYLFIEAGGFNENNPPTWKSPVVVLKRAAK
jgi:hypothetical protein